MLDIEVKPNGFIGQPAEADNVLNEIGVYGVNFLSYRRHNLRNITVNCGLVVRKMTFFDQNFIHNIII